MKILLLFLLMAVYATLAAQNQSSNEKNLFQSERIPPRQVKQLGEGHYFFDFGKDAFGTLLLRLKANQNDTLIIHLGEKLNEQGAIDRKPGGTIRYQRVELASIPVNEEMVLQLPRNRRNTLPQAVALPDSFGVVMPFRYCEIEHLNSPLDEFQLEQKVYHYRFNEKASSFTSSDTLLNQVWNLCKYTIKATSFTGLYIDGDRERIPYEADAYINQLSHYCVDHEYGMARATIKHFMKHPTWPTEWLLHTIMMVYQDYYYTGDTNLLAEYYPQLKAKTLYELAGKDGLISSSSDKVTGRYMAELGFSDTTQRVRDIVDWPPAQKDTGWKLSTEEGERDGHEMLPVNTVVNCFFYENMRIMAELAGVLKNKEDQLYFTQMAAKVKQSINTKLFDREKGRYIDGIGSVHSSVHANMLPLAFGLVPEEYEQSVADFVKSRGMACSVYGAQYLLEGLYNAGEAEYALELMTSTSDRSWWNMIRVGSTMTLEAWDIRYKPNLDWNHAWGSAPGNIVTRYLWGIRPAKPGFDKVQVKPQMADLKYSTIKVPTIKGAISAEFKKIKDEGTYYSIELPASMKGDFILTSGQGKNSVEVNNKAYIVENGQIHLESGKTEIFIKE